MDPRSTQTPRLTPGARRILEVASDLFYHRGIHAVGVDTIAAESGVTKRTLYDRFGSKDALVTAYLQARHDQWWARLEDRLETAEKPRALAVFEAYTRDELPLDRGCAFLNAAGELPAGHPARAVVREHKRAVRRLLTDLVHEDHGGGADAVAGHLFLLLEGAVAQRGVVGDAEPLRAARTLAEQLLGDTTPPGA
ncbi:TetR/AcrR family transcriptional regulator [Georgenia wutianyii]|uniref:TetR/AcrR family transcriptional regulator n=1 Tax=Georgenia wutianyii TaxID=2585135 RepID=A0ABX5VKE2_9MICO|nr:TetR/AcrR family transcriptional regulator [Georgenia wutianyii]QDB78298.1 TetR/AcrR family transcriptional regulator [Georgenia wutianyii]